tara:strand:- start:573 stop:842 length:270 start_codon:yes stop_codon:yes gene_type:complete
MNGLKKTYTANGSDTFDHNGQAGVIAVAVASGSGTITLSHNIGGVDVTIDSFAASGGAQFVSPKGELKVTASGISSATIHVEVQPLATV